MCFTHTLDAILLSHGQGRGAGLWCVKCLYALKHDSWSRLDAEYVLRHILPEADRTRCVQRLALHTQPFGDGTLPHPDCKRPEVQHTASQRRARANRGGGLGDVSELRQCEVKHHAASGLPSTFALGCLRASWYVCVCYVLVRVLRSTS